MAEAATADRRHDAARGDAIFHALCFSAALVLMATLAGLIIALAIGGWPAFSHFGIGFLTTAVWDPVADAPEIGFASSSTNRALDSSLAPRRLCVGPFPQCHPGCFCWSPCHRGNPVKASRALWHM